MHKNRSNKHSKSKSNTLHFRGRHSLINKYRSKIKNNHSNSHSKNGKNNDRNNHNHHTHSDSTTDNINTTNIHNNTSTNSIQFKLPPLTQIGNNSNASIGQSIIHTSPSTSNTYYTQKCNISTIHSISSDNTNTSNYQFTQIPHSPSASYSFSETNNSSTNPDFIVMIEPQTSQHHPINPFHPQKHFYPTSHTHINNRPHSTSQIKSFKFDDNDKQNFMGMQHIQITNNISNQSIQSIQSNNGNNYNNTTTTITPTQLPISNGTGNGNNAPQTIISVPSPSQQSAISQLSLISQTERFQQLQPDPSSTQMTPTPSPSAPNWNNITNSITNSSSPMHPISLNSNTPENLELHTNNQAPKPRRYGSRSHLIDESSKDNNSDNDNDNDNDNNNDNDNDNDNDKDNDNEEEEVDVVNNNNNNTGKRDSIKNVKIGQTTMHPYRVYNEANIYPNSNNNTGTHLDKPLNSVNSVSSAISIETEHSMSHSFDGGSTTTGASNSYNPLPQNYGNYNPSKITTAHTATKNIQNNNKKDKLKHIRIKLTPTTSTPIKSPHSNSYNNVKWQTYIGHFVFHEHDRGHSLYHTFKKIGEGVFARVYKTIRKEPQRTVALKVFPKKNRYAEGSFANELMLMHNVSHPNIVQLYDAHVDPKYFYLEMEVCRGGDIFKHISRKGPIDERCTRQIIYKIVDAIRCFHERDFVHRDLKPENIVFVNQNDISDIRLIDFGESIHVEPQGYYNEFVGTPCYFAPERFRQHTGAELKKCDVWAIGVIMFEMVTGCRCFKGGDNTFEVKNNILNKKMEQFPNDLILSSNATDFFHKLLEYEPLKRYSCHQALRHDWLYDIFQHKQYNIINNFHISPRLTPVNNNTSNIDSMQAIVIRTSQSMTNLQNVFEQHVNDRYGNNKKKKIERKYKEEHIENKTENNNDNNNNNNNGGVPWKLRITRKKSRSLEQNELQRTLRNKDGTSFHRLTLPKHGDKYRMKHRSHTLGSNAQQQQEHNNNNNNDNVEHNEQVIETETETYSPIGPMQTMHKLKHQKSLSSPAMNSSINAIKNSKYHPSPVHEDHEHNDSIHSNHWKHTNTNNSITINSNNNSISYSNYAFNQINIHEKKDSFSINSTLSYTENIEDKVID